MRWWSEDSPHYVDWREDSREKIEDDTPQRCEEACYADCEECKVELCVVVEFVDVTPVAVLSISRQADWAGGHYA
jgi:hypothetical protein